jgi:hypothetical protein
VPRLAELGCADGRSVRIEFRVFFLEDPPLDWHPKARGASVVCWEVHMAKAVGFLIACIQQRSARLRSAPIALALLLLGPPAANALTK